MITILYKKDSSEEFDEETTDIRETGNFLILDFHRFYPEEGINKIWRTRYIPLEKINEVVVTPKI